MYVTIVQTIESTEVIKVFGPFRSLAKAEQVRDLCRNPQAVEYFDYEDHMVFVARLSTYGD